MLFVLCYFTSFQSVMHSDSEYDKSGMGMAAISTPTQPYLNTTQNDGVLNGSMMTKAGTPIRPLTAAYRAASSEQQVWNMREREM